MPPKFIEGENLLEMYVFSDGVLLCLHRATWVTTAVTKCGWELWTIFCLLTKVG